MCIRDRGSAQLTMNENTSRPSSVESSFPALSMLTARAPLLSLLPASLLPASLLPASLFPASLFPATRDEVLVDSPAISAQPASRDTATISERSTEHIA